jgi:NADH dehydrogenase
VRVLVTGATGFVGRAVLPILAQTGHQVRILLRPSLASPRLPKGVAVEVGLSDLTDAPGVRAALLGMDAVLHLAAERAGSRADLSRSDSEATRTLVEAAGDSGIRRLIYLSHLGADRASAYPLLRAKAIAEEAVRQGNVSHTIVRAAALYGPEDRFTTSLAMTLALSPGVFFLPGDDGPPVAAVGRRSGDGSVWALTKRASLAGRTKLAPGVSELEGSRRTGDGRQPPASDPCRSSPPHLAGGVPSG